MKKHWRQFMGFIAYHRDVIISIGFFIIILITIGSMYTMGKT